MIHSHSLIERITRRIIAMDPEALPQQEESQRLRRHTRNKVIVAVLTATFLGGIFLYALDSLINNYWGKYIFNLKLDHYFCSTLYIEQF